MKNLNIKDLLAKYKALPAKTKNLIMVILGIAIFIGAYMLGFQKLSAATAEIKEESETQASYVNELKNYHENIQVYENGISEAKNEINTNLKKLPYGIKNEDFLMYVRIMNDKIGADLKDVTFGADNFIGEFGCTIDEKNVTAQAMGASVTYATTLTYPQFKDMLKYIYTDTKEITFVDTVSLTFNSADLKLEARFSVNKFFIEYEGCQYTPVPIPDTPLGVEDPFGTE